MTRTIDLVEIIERLYEPTASAQAFYAQAVHSLRPLLDVDGVGLGSHRYDVRDVDAPKLAEQMFDGLPLPPEVLRQAHVDAAPDVVARLYDWRGIATTTSTLGLLDHPGLRAMFAMTGANDAVALRVEDAPRVGWIAFAARRRVTKLSARECGVFERIARHVATAARIWQRSSDELGEAVLSPEGRVEHALGVARGSEARAALSGAAKRIDKARGALRRVSPEEAIAEWRALVEGRWSLVDHFDHDGRRYLVAVRNEPNARSARRLSKREREVCALVAMGHANKLIAYELGLSTPTVASYLASAMRKLEVTSRVELVARWNAVPGRRGQ